MQVAATSDWSMLAHWAEPNAVHLALFDHHDNTAAVATLPCPSGRFPSIGRHHAPAIRLERTIHDLYGLMPEHAPDRAALARSWPLAEPPTAGGRAEAGGRSDDARYPFLAADGEGLHQIAVGPVHAGIIEPGHFRFTANGETVVRLEERLGYAHKGIEALLVGAESSKARNSPAACPATARSQWRWPSRTRSRARFA